MSADPYAPPSSHVDDSRAGAEPRKRPVLVWLILILQGFGVIAILLSTWALVAGKFPMTPQLQAYFNGLGMLGHGVTAGIALVTLVGSIQLFRLRARSPDILLAGFVLLLLWDAYQYFALPVFGEIFAAGWIGNVISFALTIAIILYAYGLRRRGILR
jgi:hypothetical protein